MEYIQRCSLLMPTFFFSVLGPDSRKWANIHSSSKLPDSKNEGREGGIGTLRWRIHNDESLNI